MPTQTTVTVDHQRVRLSNLERVLYPDASLPSLSPDGSAPAATGEVVEEAAGARAQGHAGVSKAEVLTYYARIAPVILPHLRQRPVSFLRCPDGVDGQRFFAKNAPKGTPEWVTTADLPSPGSTKGSRVEYVVLDSPAAVVWAANLAALEFHVPQWRLPRGRGGGYDGPGPSDRLVFDLDPGEGMTIVECCRVACLLRELLDGDGLKLLPKTSGSKGLHLYAALAGTPGERVVDYAHTAARRLEKEHPDLVVSRMRKDLRRDRVFVDWSQNNPAKTTVAPYSLRARTLPTVSTPLTWDEVEHCGTPEELVFTAADALLRVERHGDLLEPLLTERHRLPKT